MTNLRYIVRLATLFRALGSSGDTDGSLKSGEQRFIRPHVARPIMSLKYGQWQLTLWRFTHTRPKGNQRLFPRGSPRRPAKFSLFKNNSCENVAMG